MRTLALAVLLAVCAFPISAGHAGSKAEYIGGTRPDIPDKNDGAIQVTDKTYFIFASKKTQVRVPYERINLLEYGQKVDRRYLAAAVISPILMFMKKREHFLTVGFQDDDGQQQAMVFRIDKNDIRLTLVALEARTGQEVRYQDDEARIAGKG
jgi:6-phosphogluconolactonase (cycloisomerase 2 family)